MKERNTSKRNGFCFFFLGGFIFFGFQLFLLFFLRWTGGRGGRRRYGNEPDPSGVGGRQHKKGNENENKNKEKMMMKKKKKKKKKKKRRRRVKVQRDGRMSAQHGVPLVSLSAPLKK